MESKHPNNMKIAKRTQGGRSLKICIRVHPCASVAKEPILSRGHEQIPANASSAGPQN